MSWMGEGDADNGTGDGGWDKAGDSSSDDTYENGGVGSLLGEGPWLVRALMKERVEMISDWKCM